MNDKKIDCLFVTGMYRSGISVLAQCLGIVGINFGQGRSSPFETISPVEREISAVHDIFFRDTGTTWDMIGAPPIGWEKSSAADSARRRIRNVIETYFEKNGTWAVADARLCRLMPLWSAVLQEKKLRPGFVLMLRHPWEVSLSLKQNNGIDCQKGHLLWLAMNKQVFDFCRHGQYVVNTYDQILADPVTILSGIEERLNLSFPNPLRQHVQPILQTVRPEIKHHHTNSPDQTIPDNEIFLHFSTVYDHMIGHRSENTLLDQKIVSDSVLEPLKSDTIPVNFNRDLFAVHNSNIASQEQPNRHRNDIFNFFLSFFGQYEREFKKAELQKMRHILSSRHAMQTIFARLLIPSSKKKENRETVDILLLQNEWQQVQASIAEPKRLRSQPIVFSPLNTRGVVSISDVSVLHEITEEVFFRISKAAEFKQIELEQAVQIPDKDAFVIMTTGDNATLTFSVLPDLPDVPVKLQVWLKVDTNQHIAALTLRNLIDQNRKDREKVEKKLATALHETKAQSKALAELGKTNKDLSRRLLETRNRFERYKEEKELGFFEISEARNTANEENIKLSRLLKERDAALAEKNKEVDFYASRLDSLNSEIARKKNALKIVNGQKRKRISHLAMKDATIQVKEEEVQQLQEQVKKSKATLACVITAPFRKINLLLKKTFNRFRSKKKQIGLIKQSEHFDSQWYLERYPDVSKVNLDPAEHYFQFGASEARDPGPHFNTTDYVKRHPDVTELGMNPLVHYMVTGKRKAQPPPVANRIDEQIEAIKASELFDGHWYLRKYRDVKGMDPAKHYCHFGSYEGRNPGPDFDTNWYLDTYPDVVKTGLNPLFHYISIGREEGRECTGQLKMEN